MPKHRKAFSKGRVAVVGGVTLAMFLTPAAAYAGPNWDPVIECESGGDPQAENASSTASGLLQITDPTWEQYGGKGSHAANASVGEQMRVAAEIYADRGLQPWTASKSCWADSDVSTAPVAAAAEAETTVTAPARQVETHTVVSGDTVSALAHRYGRTTAELRVDNHLRDIDKIRVGLVLEV